MCIVKKVAQRREVSTYFASRHYCRLLDFHSFPACVSFFFLLRMLLWFNEKKRGVLV